MLYGRVVGDRVPIVSAVDSESRADAMDQKRWSEEVRLPMALSLPANRRRDFGWPRLRATFKRLHDLIAARNEQSLDVRRPLLPRSERGPH